MNLNKIETVEKAHFFDIPGKCSNCGYIFKTIKELKKCYRGTGKYETIKDKDGKIVRYDADIYTLCNKCGKELLKKFDKIINNKK